MVNGSFLIYTILDGAKVHDTVILQIDDVYMNDVQGRPFKVDGVNIQANDNYHEIQRSGDVLKADVLSDEENILRV